MTTLTWIILLALLATLVALGTGLGSMVRGGVFDARHSTQFMFARIGAQAIALVLLLVAMYLASTGHAG